MLAKEPFEVTLKERDKIDLRIHRRRTLSSYGTPRGKRKPLD